MTQTEETTRTLADFIAQTGITMTARQVASNPHMTDMGEGARHWRCTLRNGTTRIVVAFSQGSAHTEAPTVADLLDCLASDARAYDGAQDFADFASELGYDADSRKAYRTYKACGDLSTRLCRLLGGDLYHELLHEVEPS